MLVRPSQLWFAFIHSNFLIYNICWEDVEADLKLLSFSPTSRLLTITSAGDNALGYTLKDIEHVASVDVNPRQTYLLELKLALLNYGNQHLFYECFAKGKSSNLLEEFPEISQHLSNNARIYWSKHIRYFNPKGRGLFLQGGAGYFARLLNRIIDSKNLRRKVQELAHEPDSENRKQLFDEIANVLWSGKDQYVWKSDFVLGMAGIPKSQRLAIGDMNTFIQKVIYSTFVKQQASKNPYWGAYLGFEVAPEHQSPYLKPENFEALKKSAQKLQFQTQSLYGYLKSNDQNFSHFVLLDHMDWMTDHNFDLLSKQWKLILNRSTPNAQYLFRTAHQSLDFLPDFVRERIAFQKVDEHWIERNDRVGTYTGTYVGIRT